MKGVSVPILSDTSPLSPFMVIQRWRIYFDFRILFLAERLRVWPYEGFIPKGKQPRSIPLNKDVIRVLKKMHESNINSEYVRRFIGEKAQFLAIVGLHVNTFKPFTGTKTSVIFLQKWRTEDEITNDYPIFMGASEEPGKDNSGSYVFKKKPDGSYLLDENGKRQVDHDLDDIAEAFIQFAHDQGLDFWKD